MECRHLRQSTARGACESGGGFGRPAFGPPEPQEAPWDRTTSRWAVSGTSATGLARVSEEGELTEPSVEETDCLTCDEASLCEPACSRGGATPPGRWVCARPSPRPTGSPSTSSNRPCGSISRPPRRVSRDAPVAESTGVLPTVNARPTDKPESLGFRSKTFKFRSSSVDTGLNMLENRATHVASGYAMLMPLTLRVMEKLR